MFNLIKRLLNPKIKIMDKLHVLIALHEFYSSFKDVNDVERVKILKAEIDRETAKLVAMPKELLTKSTEEIKKPVDVVKPKTVEVTKPVTETVEKTKEVPPVEEEDEKVYDVLPFYPCQVKADSGKMFDIAKPPKAFTIAEDEETQVKVNKAYPTVDEFDMIMDEAWEMTCRGSSAKDLNVFFKKNLDAYYKSILKSESDYYTKLSNPMVAAVSLIKKAFNQHPKSTNVLITRPDGYQSGNPGVPIILESKSDMVIEAKPEDTKKPDAKVEEKKPELKTVQTGKPAPKTESKPVVDEEVQETGKAETEEATEAAAIAAQLAEEEAEANAAKGKEDKDNPPAVNHFDKFNDFENSILEKYVEGEKLAVAAKTDDEKKIIRANKRDESRSLIQSWFEDSSWVENSADGKWNVKLISYHNNLLKEIQSNKAKWPK
jgi:hypothetical protein